MASPSVLNFEMGVGIFKCRDRMCVLESLGDVWLFVKSHSRKFYEKHDMLVDIGRVISAN